MAKKKLTLEDMLVPKEEIPYEVPENWCWVKLGAVAQWSSGGTPSTKVSEYYDGDIPWVVIGDLNDGAVCASKRNITELGLSKSSAKWVDIDSVLIAMYGASIGKIGINKIKCTTNQAIAFTKEIYEVTTYKYIYYYLLCIRERLIGLGKGGAQPNISQTVIKEEPIPIPPLAEQERIVKKIESLFEKVDKARELVNEARDGFEKRRAAILEKAFCGELTAKSDKFVIEDNIDLSILNKDAIEFDMPYELSNGWKWIRFNECCTFLGSGVTPKGGSSVYTDEGIPFIRSQNVLKGSLDMSDVVYISEEIQEKMKRTTVKPNDTLLNITGASIGRCSYVSDEIEVANVNQHVCILRFKDYIDYKYPSYWINSPTFQNIINKEQIGATRQALNFKQLRGMWIPVPPIEEQRKIVDALDRLIEKEQEIEKSSDMTSNCEVIKKSILAKAFRGELGSNDLEEVSSLKLIENLIK
ncbi:MAG: restriction endonuclease subunit S [Terrisporobacter sp.]